MSSLDRPSLSRPRAHRLLSGLLLVTGGSALLCGGVIAFDPHGTPLGLTPEFLAGSPFDDWLLPGLALAGFVGVSFLVTGVWTLQRRPRHRELAVVAGLGLVVFEVVEWDWMGFNPLQVVFIAVGGAVAGLAVRG